MLVYADHSEIWYGRALWAAQACQIWPKWGKGSGCPQTRKSPFWQFVSGLLLLMVASIAIKLKLKLNFGVFQFSGGGEAGYAAGFAAVRRCLR